MIALFDSGYGGLTVLKPILEKLPQYEFIYLGDNARAPYGSHNKENITKFTTEAVDYLFDRGAVLIIFACNTASTVALRTLQQKYLNGPSETNRKILGVTIPVAEHAAKTTKNKHVAVVGTKATIESGSYEQEIHKIDPEIRVSSMACPLLVPFIEESWHDKPEAKSVLKKYLRPLKSHNADTLILGCTHYPLMLKEFKKYMGNSTKILYSNVVAESLSDYLERHPVIEKKLKRSNGENAKCTYLTTDDPQTFQRFAQKNLGLSIALPEKITLQ